MFPRFPLVFAKGSCLLVLFCLFGAGAFAQSIEISGKVSDSESGETLGGATVTVPAQGTGALADAEGNYTVKVSWKDTVRIVVKMAEYDDAEIAYTPPKGQASSVLNIKLRKPIEIGTVILTASKTEQKAEELTTSYNVVTTKQVDNFATSNIQDVIENVPGVTIIDDQINIRGSSGYAYGVGSRVILALNGLPLLTPDAGSAQFDMIPTDNIKQIEVIKGASSVLYGSSALGGVINVITDDPKDKPLTTVRIRGSVFDSPSNKALDWDGSSAANIFSAHIFHARKIKNFYLTTQGDFIKDSGYRIADRESEARFKLLTKWRPEKVKGLVVGVNFNAVLDSSDGSLWWDRYDADTSLVIDTAYNVFSDSLPPTIDIDTNYIVHSGALAPDQSTVRRQSNNRFAVDPYINYLTKGGQLHALKARYMYTSNKNNTNQSSQNQLIYTEYQFTTPVFGKTQRFRGDWISGLNYVYQDVKAEGFFGFHEGTQAAAYSQFNLKFGRTDEITKKFVRRGNFSLGFRYQRNTIDSLEVSAAPLFSTGLSYRIMPGLNARASFGQAFRTPSIAERFTSTNAGGVPVIPNPDIRDESGYSIEIGLNQGFKFGDDRFTGYVDVAAFEMQYEDMIEFGVRTRPTFGLGPSNVSNARIRGVEGTFMLNGDVSEKFGFNVTGGLTYTDAIDLNHNPDSTYLIDNPATWDFPDRPEFLKYRTKWLARVSGTLELKPVFLTTNFRRATAVENVDQILYLLIPGTRKFWDRVNPDGLTVVDFILGYNFDQSTVSFHVFNAFNAEYAFIPGILKEQRQFSVQYKVSF